MKSLKLLFFALILIGLTYSCQSSKNIIYVQNAGAPVDLSKSTLPTLPEIIIKNGDMLNIKVSTYTAEASAPFNTVATSGYLVDNQGDINFPVLGKLNVVGQSKRQIEDKIRNLIYPKYVNENTIVSVKISNFKVTILGDMGGNKVIPVSDDRITILEAIAQAGDLLLSGRRDNVLLIRENEIGKRETYRLDLRDKNLIDSPFYYLQQNDLLYIEPNKNKARIQSPILGQILTYSTPVLTLISLGYTLLKR
ncbi:MAG: polysaccharide biosynthesis/export family protein [Bacteroidales bacterium]